MTVDAFPGPAGRFVREGLELKAFFAVAGCQRRGLRKNVIETNSSRFCRFGHGAPRRRTSFFVPFRAKLGSRQQVHIAGIRGVGNGTRKAEQSVWVGVEA